MHGSEAHATSVSRPQPWYGVVAHIFSFLIAIYIKLVAPSLFHTHIRTLASRQ